MAIDFDEMRIEILNYFSINSQKGQLSNFGIDKTVKYDIILY